MDFTSERSSVTLIAPTKTTPLNNNSTLSQEPEKVKEILLIFKTEIRRKDLAEALKQFKCSSQFLQQYNLK
jgi:hypothetical protein